MYEVCVAEGLLQRLRSVICRRVTYCGAVVHNEDTELFAHCSWSRSLLPRFSYCWLWGSEWPYPVLAVREMGALLDRRTEDGGTAEDAADQMGHRLGFGSMLSADRREEDGALGQVGRWPWRMLPDRLMGFFWSLICMDAWCWLDVSSAVGGSGRWPLDFGWVPVGLELMSSDLGWWATDAARLWLVGSGMGELGCLRLAREETEHVVHGDRCPIVDARWTFGYEDGSKFWGCLLWIGAAGYGRPWKLLGEMVEHHIMVLRPHSSRRLRGGGIAWIALALRGSTLMPRCRTTKLRNLPVETLNAHFSGFIFRSYLQRTNDQIVDVAFHGPVEHVVEDGLHGPLVSCPGVLESEWHEFVTKAAHGGSKGSCCFVCRAIREGERVVQCRAVDKELRKGERKLILWACLIE
ncbi:hypothetical protein ACLOJK_034959, partial [Asimina triloba]